MGERVILDIHGSTPKPAIIRWSLLGNAGLKFCDWQEQSQIGGLSLGIVVTAGPIAPARKS